jgi:hypothetical protein
MSLSPAKLETSLYWFNTVTGYDIPWDVAAANFEYTDCRTKLSEVMSPSMGLKAINMLQQRLQIAERSADEDTALAFVGTIARLERADEVEHG